MLSFTAPKGWEIPPDAKPGQPFQGVGTFILGDDGQTVKFTEIDGTPLADGAADNEAEETQPDDEEAEGETEQPEAPDHMADMVERAKKAGLMK